MMMIAIKTLMKQFFKLLERDMGVFEYFSCQNVNSIFLSTSSSDDPFPFALLVTTQSLVFFFGFGVEIVGGALLKVELCDLLLFL